MDDFLTEQDCAPNMNTAVDRAVQPGCAGAGAGAGVLEPAPRGEGLSHEPQARGEGVSPEITMEGMMSRGEPTEAWAQAFSDLSAACYAVLRMREVPLYPVQPWLLL